jgi:phosphoribosyl 1,2-cyclic phosphate phosphodiesterase
MKVTILGCGCSGGVPLIGNIWGDCDPNEPRNRRQCCSILVEEGETTLLVDTSPDMRAQLLACNLKSLTAVLYTHSHADHCHGIDGLRSVNWLIGKPVPIYGSEETIQELTERFPYIFGDRDATKKFYKPALEPHVIAGDLVFGSLRVKSFEQKHGAGKTLGFRFNDLVAYSTDVNELDETAFGALSGVKNWIVDCARERSHPSHANLPLSLSWIERIKPERAWLTHMDHSMDYATLAARLPPGVAPAYDGLVIEC